MMIKRFPGLFISVKVDRRVLHVVELLGGFSCWYSSIISLISDILSRLSSLSSASQSGRR